MMRQGTVTESGTPLTIGEAKIPDVPPRGALVKTSFAGVCHSDLHVIDLIKNKGAKQFEGMVPGHEISGVIEKLGTDVDKGKYGLNEGDNVCVYPWIGCQDCSDCKSGYSNTCPTPGADTFNIGLGSKYGGGYGTYVIVPDLCSLVRVPENVPMSVACMLPCSAATAYSSLKKASGAMKKGIEVNGKCNLLIIGAGGLGLWCLILAKKAFFPGNINVTMADISKDKVKMAKETGADDVIIWDKDQSEQDMIQMVTQEGKAKFDAVINFVGSPKSTKVGIFCLVRKGVEVVLGLFGGALEVPMQYLVMNSISLIGSLTSTLAELEELVQLVSDKGLDYSNLTYYPLDEVNTALNYLQAGKVEGRAIVKHD